MEEDQYELFLLEKNRLRIAEGNFLHQSTLYSDP